MDEHTGGPSATAPDAADAASAEEAARRATARTSLAVLALLFLPATAAVVVARSGDDVAPLPPEVDVVEGPAQTAAFLEAFERSRTGTYVARQVTERQRAGAVALTSSHTIVQRPPDRLVVTDGSVDGWRDGRVVSCIDEQCWLGDEGFDAAAEVERQLANLAALVEGDEPVYAVGAEADGDCFLLDLLRQVPAPPYGTFARFCFDDATGAPLLLRVERPDAVDETVTDLVTPTVTDEDLALPVD